MTSQRFIVVVHRFKGGINSLEIGWTKLSDRLNKLIGSQSIDKLHFLNEIDR